MRKNKLFLYIVSAVICSGLLFSLFVFLKIRSIRTLRAATESINTETAARASRADRADKIQIPSQIWASELLETAYAKALKIGIKDIQFEQKKTDETMAQRSNQNSGSRIRQYPVRMHFHSGYREMAEFIRGLQSLDKPITLDSVTVRPEKDILAVEITAVTYSMEAK